MYQVHDDEYGNLKFRVASNVDKQSMEGESFQISRSITNSVLRTGQPECITDVLTDRLFSAQASVVALDLRSVLCVPLKYQNSIIGIIYVDSKSITESFSTTDLEFLQAFANRAAIAIENAELYNTVKELNTELEKKVQLRTQQLSESNKQLEQTLNELKQAQKELLKAERLSAIAEIVVGINHEINNPLSAILWRAQLLQQQCIMYVVQSRLSLYKNLRP